MTGYAAILAAPGCHGCHGDHPYVPYAIVTPEAAVVDAGPVPIAAAPEPVDGGRVPFSGEPAILASPGTTHWSVEGLTIDAPAGAVFVSAVVGDFDGDGAKDAFAIVRPPEGSDPGTLAFYRGNGTTLGPPTTVIAPPLALARDADCTPKGRLVASTRAVLVELGAECVRRPLHGPARWVAVVVRGKVTFAATIADPPGAPTLSVDADVSDRDGDGRDDVALRISMEGGSAPLEPGPLVSGTFVWLDRPAGLSRDTSAAESSFASLAANATARAARPSDAPAVPSYVAEVRALYRATCDVEGSPRFVPVAGAGAMACGAASALEEIGLAEARAYTTMGDALRASLAIDRAERPPAARTASRRREAMGLLAQVAPIAKASLVRPVAAVPAESSGHGPSWGPLAFDGAGKLLVRTRAGVVRVDPEQGDEASASDVAVWKSAVSSLDGATLWIEAYDPCDGLPLRATFEPASGEDLHDLALPVVPRVGARCAGSRGAPARATAVAWGPAGLEAIVEEQPILIAPDLAHASDLAMFLDQPFAAGSPRSPDGKSYVVPTGAGLVVRGAGRTRLFRAADLDGTYDDQRECAVSDDETHVACVRAGAAWVGTWGPP